MEIIKKQTIIDSIEKEEVTTFVSQEEKRKKRIRYFAAGIVLFLLSLSIYILPDFLSESHKNNMAYIGEDFHQNEEEKKEEEHASPYNSATYHE